MRGYSLDLSKELCHILILKISVAKTGTILSKFGLFGYFGLKGKSPRENELWDNHVLLGWKRGPLVLELHGVK